MIIEQRDKQNINSKAFAIPILNATCKFSIRLIIYMITYIRTYDNLYYDDLAIWRKQLIICNGDELCLW